MKAVWLGAGLVVLFIVVWMMHDVLLLFFAAAIFAVPLREAARAVAGKFRLPPGGGLAVVLVALILVAGGLAWVWELMIAEQVAQLVVMLPAAVAGLARAVHAEPWASRIATFLPDPALLFTGAGGLLGAVLGVFGGTLAAVVNAAILIFAAVCFAAEPRTYVDGLLRIVPLDHRARVNAVLLEAAGTVTLWLRARSISMFTIAVMSTIGLALLGVPDALALGVISGLLAFVPNIGPIAAALPAVLIAATFGWERAVAVVILYWLAHAIDDFLVIPFAERRVVRLPPVLTIGAQLVLGLAAGIIGVMVAAPFVAVGIVLVHRLIVEDIVERKSRVASLNVVPR